jgi:hypothetical protein
MYVFNKKKTDIGAQILLDLHPSWNPRLRSYSNIQRAAATLVMISIDLAMSQGCCCNFKNQKILAVHPWSPCPMYAFENSELMPPEADVEKEL